MTGKELSEQEKFLKDKRRFLIVRIWHSAEVFSIGFSIFLMLSIFIILYIFIYLHITPSNALLTDFLVVLFLALFFELLSLALRLSRNRYQRVHKFFGIKVVSTYLDMIFEGRLSRNNHELKKRSPIVIDYLRATGFVKWYLKRHIKPDLELPHQLRSTLIEFTMNFVKFVEAQIICDQEMFDDLMTQLKKTSSTFFDFIEKPSNFLEDYYILKETYEKRPDYLKQFKRSQLYNINTRWKLPSGFLRELIYPIVINVAVVIVIALIAFKLHIIA